jgi:MraZ protein
MPDEAASRITYSAIYRHSVDDKRRVSVPFRWRPDEPIEFTVIAWPKHKAGSCLLVLPPGQVVKLLADIDAMPGSDPNKSVLKRHIGKLSIQAKLDGSGRIALPEDMAKEAGINGQAVLVGCLDRFEIWSPDRYEQAEAFDQAALAQAMQLIE